MTEKQARPLFKIASEIWADWKRVNFAARPYLQAMLSLETMEDSYGMDSAESVVLYFLSNANSWKGVKAREIKAELREMVKRKPPKRAERKLQ